MKIKRLFEYLTICRSGSFDANYYLRTYDDIRRADTPPLNHYLSVGWKEGRNPSAEFDTSFYLRTNSDVAKADINPLAHYLRYGQKEGRLPKAGNHPQRVLPTTKLPKRALRTVARKLYKALPLSISQRQRLKTFVFKFLPQLASLPNSVANGFFDPTYTPGNLIDVDTVSPVKQFNQKIAVHMHIFYSDLIPEFVRYAANLPFPYDLFISAVSDEVLDQCNRAFRGLPNQRNLTAQKVDNRGRDIAPFFCAFGAQLKQYDIVAHFHTKKSLYNQGSTLGWREYLLNELLGSQDRIKRLFNLLQEVSPYGLIYPQTHIFLPGEAHTWLANLHLAQEWQGRFGFQELPKGYFDFPAGSMFWARKEALLPLFEAGLKIDDFPEERGQTDGTLAHMLERFLGVSATNQGYKIAILKDKQNYSWSAWRFDRILQRSFSDLSDAYKDTTVKVIGFDIFDTLLCRPLLDPESTKKIVARRSPKKTGSAYLRFRAMAEDQARVIKGVDVGLDETYQELRKLSGLSDTEIFDLRSLEENVEKESIRPREEGISLYQHALQSSKPTTLISDTSLPEDVITQMLNRAGISGWGDLFVSNKIGLRKDTGELYDRVFEQFKTRPGAFLMTGDSERSDFQIPIDRGSQVVHILRPIEIARGMPRLSALINHLEKRGGLDEELTIGPIVLHNFSRLVYPDLDPTSMFSPLPENIGYSLVGPLLVSFSQWLLGKAQEDRIDRLYFLSREGRIMKAVYDAWTADIPDAPRSEYLVVSRRCSSMATLTSFEDMIEIAKTTYFPNSLGKLLITRYGINPSPEKWQEISQTVKLNPKSIIEIQDKKIGNLKAVLTILQEEIFAQAASERVGLLAQLKELGFQTASNPAVVDVGYGGTVQGHLNKILEKGVHGYYLLTEDRANTIANHYDVRIRGCFGENISNIENAPIMFRFSFELEKLLSSNDAQIEFYLVEKGRAIGQYRPLTPAELEPALIRDDIQAGALKYVADLREIRHNLLPDLQPSCFVASSLMDAFLGNLSGNEKALLSRIVLDDYYCGRDLVS